MSLKEKMTALADAVREKAELTDVLTIDGMTDAVNGLVVGNPVTQSLTVTPSKTVQNFASADLGENTYYSTVTVQAIPSEYITTEDATANSGDILSGKTAYISGGKVTGTMTHVGALKVEMTPENDYYYNTGGYVSLLQVYAHSETKTFTPSSERQTYSAADKFVGEVIINPIPSNYIVTDDATAVSGDILEGKIAYVKGEKVTGTLKEAQQASVEANSVTIFPGIVSEEYTVTVAEMAAVTVDSNVVTVPAGYNSAEQTITVGTAKEAETFTPGTSDITIPADTYLTGEQVIRGDSNLTPENIKKGVTIFDVEGNFTDDADAIASDIASGKTAYVKGEKITGTATASGGSVSPMWEYNKNDSWGIRTNIPQCNTYNVPSRGDSSARFRILDGNLIDFNTGIPKKYDEKINWTYVSMRNTSEYEALGDGKLYKLSSINSYTATPLFPSLSGITQVGCMTWGTLCCTSSGELYGGGGNDLTKVRRVEYTREKDTDPIVYVNVSKILNCQQNYQEFWVITDDGSLAYGWLDKDSFDIGTGAAYAEIDTQSVANGNPFVNYYPQIADEYSDGSSATCELAFRADGLWYRQVSKEWRDGKYWYNAWTKASDPGFRKYDWLGYCSLNYYEDWDTGETSVVPYMIALHIDEQGRLWKLVPTGQMSGYEITMTGLSITQVGEDTDWQCVSPVIRKGQGSAGGYDGVWGQKGDKAVNIRASNTDTIDIAWDEYPVPIPGKMICVEGNKMYFATEGAIVDLSKAGGTF